MFRGSCRNGEGTPAIHMSYGKVYDASGFSGNETSRMHVRR